jgi:hypothetical protein
VCDASSAFPVCVVNAINGNHCGCTSSTVCPASLATCCLALPYPYYGECQGACTLR